MDSSSDSTARPAPGSAAAKLQSAATVPLPDSPDPSAHTSSADSAVFADTPTDKSADTSQGQAEDSSQPPSHPQSFAAAVFPGVFNPPKLNTSGFFSSMQGKLQSTLANTKTPALNLQPPQINKVDIKQIQASTEQLANTTKDWGVSAFKSLSSAAQRVSANVTQGIQKEHEEFIKQKKLETVVPHQGTESLPAWAGMPDEDQIKARILSLSKDKRNFLLPPPPGTDFVFDMNVYSSTATATLKQDPNLDKMRFYLVPKEVEELVFWRNYFYRVSLLKQVALAIASGSADPLSEATTTESTPEAADGSSGAGHTRTLSMSSALGYNIYFGKDDVDGPPKRSRPTSMAPKEAASASTLATATEKDVSKTAAKKAEKPEVLFETEMPDHDEDPDAWLEKQLASGVSISGTGADDDDADIDVADWEKELQNELKDYVEGS
ncbi:hypothetical protein BGZ68_009258 [Mortierella alpina]|nr:hypothetical protein BGZ68_009258 [Mortierella alpina]